MALNIGIPGLDFLNQIDISAIFSTIGRVITFFVLALIAAIVIGAILYSNKQKKIYEIDIHFFKDVNGRPIPFKDYKAAELVIPNTSIRVFHIKEIDTYIPRGTRPMGKNSYWYMLLNNGEIVNFELGSMNEDLKKAKKYFDHTDTRYAHENLKQIIKREYRDKSVKWWKEYKEVISLIVIIFVMTLSFIFIISRVANIIDKMQPVLELAKQIQEQNKEVLKYLTELKAGSGVIIK